MPCPIPLIFNASFPLVIGHFVRLITPAATTSALNLRYATHEPRMVNRTDLFGIL